MLKMRLKVTNTNTIIYSRDGTRINKMKTGTEWIGTAGGRIIPGLTGKQWNNWLDNMYKLLGSFQSL